MTALIAFIVKLVTTSGWKTYLAAGIAALLAINAALAEGGIVFLSDGIVKALAWLAAAIGGAGLRHAIGKLQNGVGLRRFALFLPLGLALGILSMGCAATPAQQGPKLGCKCCEKCDKCGPQNTVGGCECKPGGKCCPTCACEPAKRPFKLTAMPEGPPETYEVPNDGARNGWWVYSTTTDKHGKLLSTSWVWYYDSKRIGLYSGECGWLNLTSNRTEKAPWLNVPTGVTESKLTTQGERVLRSGTD